MKRSFVCLVVIIFAALTGLSQTNLVQNPDADQGTASWEVTGDAKVEEGSNKDPHFALRGGGFLTQFIKLDGAAQKYALFVGRGTTMPVQGGDISGFPSLYGYLLSTFNPDGINKISVVMSEQSLLGKPKNGDDWVLMYGIFKVPSDAVAAQIRLMCAIGKSGTPSPNPTRFDKVGFYLFDSQKDAQAFVKKLQL